MIKYVDDLETGFLNEHSYCQIYFLLMQNRKVIEQVLKVIWIKKKVNSLLVFLNPIWQLFELRINCVAVVHQHLSSFQHLSFFFYAQIERAYELKTCFFGLDVLSDYFFDVNLFNSIYKVETNTWLNWWTHFWVAQTKTVLNCFIFLLIKTKVLFKYW